MRHAYHFGQCFRQILSEKKFTQDVAADVLGWAQSTVSYYLASPKLPRPHVLGHMATRLGISITELQRGHITQVGETPGEYRPTTPIEQTFMTELRRRWQRDTNRAALELAIRTLWPDTADQVKSWLDQKPGER